ncbi:MAG: hypothetical protein CL610_27745 [Anaerolineaceae bacterium]|nr:hypothetical protein [Anaerolineaceae bacterium]
MPSTREIANYAGVSTSTVSLALNNKEGISEAMRQRVLEAANELSIQQGAYQERNMPAKSGNRAERLSILVLHSSLITATDYFKDLLCGIEDGAGRYQLQLHLSADDPRQLDDHITNLYLTDPDLRPDGVIYLGSSQIKSTLHKAIKSGLPVIQVGVPSHPDRISFIAPDEITAGYQAAKHLLDLGHRSLAVIGHQKSEAHLEQRLAGYRQALAEYQVTPDEGWLFLEDYEGEGYEVEVQRIKTVTQAFIAERPNVTAVLFSNWQSSAIGLPLLQQAGYRIPQDVSVVVFDDFEHARTYEPALTAVAYPLVQMGISAVKMVFELANSPETVRMHQILRPRLMIRESSASPTEQ